MTYRIRGLDPAPFQPLFAMTDDQLDERGIMRMTVTAKPSFPCRVTLKDREIGEQVLLLNHISHDVENPYRASHAIFVVQDAEEAAELLDEVPPVLASRILSLRGFDDRGLMAEALLTQPGETDEGIRRLFGNPDIQVIHAHNATRGCFAARIERN